jgi:hypothetical protein
MLKIVEAQPSEFGEIASLYKNESFALTEDRHFAWKYLENPFGPARVYRVLWEGELAGAVALLPRVFHYRGRPVIGLQAVDGLMGPRIRGRGFFVDAMRFVLSQEPASGGKDYFLLGFSSLPASVKALEKAGWHRLADFSVYAVPLKPSAVERAVRMPGAGPLARASWGLSRRYILRPHTGVEASEVTAFTEDLNGYFCTDHVFGDRSPAFLAWRVFNNPQARMRAFSIREGGRPVGFAVGKVEDSTLELVDLKLSRPDRRYVSALLSMVHADPAVDTVNYWCLGSPAYLSLFPRLATGRRPCSGGMFISRLRECGLPPAPESWELTRLDADW